MSAELPAPSTITVFSLPTVTFFAVPNCSKVAVSRLRPISSEITVPPVSVAISSSMALRRSPKPGALTAQVFKPPRMLLTTNVANASFSTSSAMISNGLLCCITCSSNGTISRILLIFLSTNKIYGFSNSAVKLSCLFAKYGLI